MNQINIEMPSGKELELDLSPYQKELTVKVEIKPHSDSMFSMFVWAYNDIFNQDYIGYWARGIKYNYEENEWLCIVDDRENKISKDIEDLILDRYKELCEEDKRLQTEGFDARFSRDFKFDGIHCFVMDARFACKAVASSYERWGSPSLSNWDASTLDYGAQMALFGKLVYG